MTTLIRIKRQMNQNAKPYWQTFSFNGDKNASVAAVLNAINARDPLTDSSGGAAHPIAWEYGCMVKKCGACAMLIDGLPRLACATFLSTLKGRTVTLEPLSKFPVVKDLTVDRTVIFEQLKKASLWLESKAHLAAYTHTQRYQSARCLMCGCCLEICPNFSMKSAFSGAILPVNAYRILDEEQNRTHFQALAKKYRENYYEGCGQSLACQNICPAGIPVEELMVRSNAAAIWQK